MDADRKNKIILNSKNSIYQEDSSQDPLEDGKIQIENQLLGMSKSFH